MAQDDPSDILKINQNIKIEVKEGPYQGGYTSKIADIFSDSIGIVTPYMQEEIVSLRIGLEIEVFLTGDRAAYRFDSRIVDRKRDEVPLLIISLPENIIRIQRRDYFRIDVNKGIKYRRVDEDEEYRETTTADISGGGVKMAVNEKLENDTIVEVKLDIPGLKEIPLQARVVNQYNLPGGRAVGIEFTDINIKQQDIIIGWMFDYQRNLRNKGLL